MPLKCDNLKSRYETRILWVHRYLNNRTQTQDSGINICGKYGRTRCIHYYMHVNTFQRIFIQLSNKILNFRIIKLKLARNSINSVFYVKIGQKKKYPEKMLFVNMPTINIEQLFVERKKMIQIFFTILFWFSIVGSNSIVISTDTGHRRHCYKKNGIYKNVIFSYYYFEYIQFFLAVLRCMLCACYDFRYFLFRI